MSPFRSEAQRKFLWAKKPKLAREWTDKYGSGIEGTMMKKKKKKTRKNKQERIFIGDEDYQNEPDYNRRKMIRANRLYKI